MKEQLELFIKRVKDRWEDCRGNEQATKQSLIAPLFAILGYDMTDPKECKPEYKVEFGKDRKSTKPIDWAFVLNGAFIFFVEAKEVGTKKLGSYAEQLGDYFAKEPQVKLGILTNGIEWKFFTDVINENVMDKEPFFTWDVLNDDPAAPMDLLTLLQKSNFKAQLIRTFAEKKHHHNLLVRELNQLLEPSAEFTRLAIQHIETRKLGEKVIESWKPILRNAIHEWAKQHALTLALQHPNAEHQSSTTEDKSGLQPGADRKREEAAITLTDIIQAGVLVPPVKLFRTYKGTRLEATLLAGGAVEFQGQRYDTCSGAAEAARATVSGQKMNTNGWTFWQYQGTGGKKATLRDARHQVVSPHREGTNGQKGPKDQPERHHLRKKFWQALLDRPKMKGTRHADIAPGVFSWIGAGSGVRGMPFVYAVGQGEGRVELYTDRGAGKTAENKKIYDWLHKHKAEIEQSFGGPLSWQRLDDKQGCRIAYHVNGGGWKTDESKWPEIQDAMIDAMDRLEKALTPHLEKLKTELAL